MKFPKFTKKEKKEQDESKAEESSDNQKESIKETAKKFSFNFNKKSHDNADKKEKKSIFSGVIAKAEQMQRSSTSPIQSAKPKAFSAAGIKYRLKEYKRVLKITKKPTTIEFKTIVKASGLGIIVIGVIGFAIHMIVQTMQSI